MKRIDDVSVSIAIAQVAEQDDFYIFDSQVVSYPFSRDLEGMIDKKNEKYSTITSLSELKITILLFVGCLLNNCIFLESRKSLDMPKLVTSVSSSNLICIFGRKSPPLSNLSHPRVIRNVYTSRAETELKTEGKQHQRKH